MKKRPAGSEGQKKQRVKFALSAQHEKLVSNLII